MLADPLHEIGHKIAMNLFGFESKIYFGWGRERSYCDYADDSVDVSRSQDCIIAFSGGAFSALVLFIGYLIYPIFALLFVIVIEFIYAFYEVYITLKAW